MESWCGGWREVEVEVESFEVVVRAFFFVLSFFFVRVFRNMPRLAFLPSKGTFSDFISPWDPESTS